MRSLLVMALVGLLAGCVSSGKYQQLETDHQKVVDQSNQMAQDNDRLKQEVTGLQEEIKQQNVLIQTLKGQLGHASSSVEEMKTALQQSAERKKESERRVKEYSQLLNRFKKLIDAEKLRVKIVRGRMIVELPSDILFASGSAKLSDKGEASIKEVATILASIPDREFQIEGHTDNVPIKTARYASNWELAADRAVTVLRTMLDGGMPAQKLSIASFGEHRPVNANQTPEEKSANRRIDVVVVPDLSSLPGFEELNKLGETPAP
ncbi:MAG: OmpA family protein [Bdellovibrionales bacterium]|nr:OmpA family protein [Bdellovibrionales bacterium]